MEIGLPLYHSAKEKNVGERRRGNSQFHFTKEKSQVIHRFFQPTGQKAKVQRVKKTEMS